MPFHIYLHTVADDPMVWTGVGFELSDHVVSGGAWEDEDAARDAFVEASQATQALFAKGELGEWASLELEELTEDGDVWVVQAHEFE